MDAGRSSFSVALFLGPGLGVCCCTVSLSRPGLTFLKQCVHLLLDRYAVVQIAQGLHGIGIEPRLMLVLLELLPNQSLKGADFTLLRRASTAEACAGLNAATASSPSRMQLQSKQGLKLREGIHLCHRLSGGRACLRLACIVPAY